MLLKLVRRIGAALLLACMGAPPASAQSSTARLGWMSELAGSCWQGRDAAGAVVDRQCFQLQFDSFVRGAISRGTFRGESLLGYNRQHMQLEMYAWGNQGQPAMFTPTYRDGLYAFAGAPENGVATRAVWRRSDAGFQVVEQRSTGDGWADATIITYARDGAASPAFSAGRAQDVHGAGFRWLDSIAGRCYIQVEPERHASNQGCFAFQYPHVLRQTWIAGNIVNGEAVMFIAPNDEGVRFFYWDARGGLGVGGSAWNNAVLVSATSDDVRHVLQRRGSGFIITTEHRTGDPGAAWEYDHHFRYAAN